MVIRFLACVQASSHPATRFTMTDARAAAALWAVLVTGTAVTAGCSMIVPFSCTKEGSAASDRLVDDLNGLSSVTSAEVSTDCDSGGENYVLFATTTSQAARDEFAGLSDCKPGELPRGAAKTGWAFDCDFPSGPARVLLVPHQAMDTHQAVVQKP